MGASIWNLRPLDREPETRHFTDPEQPEWEGVTLSLRPPDGVSGTRCAVLKADLIRRHITGGWKDDAGQVHKEPDLVRCQDFSKRTPSEFVIDRCAKITALWAGEGDAPPLAEVLGWQTLLYQGWFEIANWVEDMFSRPDEQKGGTTAASSAASSTSTESTPKSPPEETPSCAASKGVSGKPLGNSAECAAPQPAAAA